MSVSSNTVPSGGILAASEIDLQYLTDALILILDGGSNQGRKFEATRWALST
jgi:hypothetical protein